MVNARIEFTKDELQALCIATEEAIETFPRWGQGKILGGLMKASRKLRLSLSLMGHERGLVHGGEK